MGNQITAKMWMIIPFLLVPFCAFPVPILGALMLQDLGRMVFIPLGLLYILKQNYESVARSRIFLFICLYFLFFNLVALYFSSSYYNSNAIVVSVKFLIWYCVLLVIPLLGVMSFQDMVPQRVFKKIYLIPLFIVFFVTCFQIPTLLRFDNFITSFYNDLLFKYIEGAWDSIPREKSNSIVEFRNLGTFSEPSVLSSFILVYCFPYQISSFANSDYIFGKIRDFLILLGAVVVLVFSLSSTAYAMLSLNIMLLGFFLMKKDVTWTKIILLLILIAPLMFLVYEFYEVYSKFISRIFQANNLSSQTRYGSIVAAINLVANNPLGVGFSMEKELLYSYIPTWGRTAETFYKKSFVQSTFLKYLAMFGLSWALFFFLTVYYSIVRFLKQKNMSSRERDQIILFSCNLLLLFVFNALEFTLVFFLVSAVFTFSPLYRKVKDC